MERKIVQIPDIFGNIYCHKTVPYIQKYRMYIISLSDIIFIVWRQHMNKQKPTQLTTFLNCGFCYEFKSTVYLFFIYHGQSLAEHQHRFKGTVPQDFLLQVFHESSFPKPLKITLWSFRISIFIENSRRYLQFKVHHRYQRHQREICLLYSWCRWYRWSIDLQISPRIFEKTRNVPNGILRDLRETDSWKKPEDGNLVALSL